MKRFLSSLTMVVVLALSACAPSPTPTATPEKPAPTLASSTAASSPAPMAEPICPEPTEGTQLLRNEAMGYCLLYPADYTPVELSYEVCLVPGETFMLCQWAGQPAGKRRFELYAIVHLSLLPMIFKMPRHDDPEESVV